ncbi:MAG: hypothetical protein P1Q69_08700 [Candidatus Thorarchaeota archaeon]|nr:hypothetical protein [Candidatus Thorarchaeota archaeon]
MSGQGEAPEANEVLIDGKQSMGNRFFDQNESYWPYMAALLAIVIFSMWALRSAFGPMTSTVIIIFYAIVCLLSTRFRMQNISLDNVQDSVNFIFIRSGVSWKTIVQALLGAALPLLLPWFVLTSSISDSTVLADLVMLIGMVIYIGLVPLAPALASISRIDILKTKVVADFDTTTSTFLNFEIDVNPLDGFWFAIQHDSKFVSQIRLLVSEFILSQLEE